MFEVRHFSERAGRVVSTLMTESQMEAHMDKLRAAERAGDLKPGFCADVVIVERPDSIGGGTNPRTGY